MGAYFTPDHFFSVTLYKEQFKRCVFVVVVVVVGSIDCIWHCKLNRD